MFQALVERLIPKHRQEVISRVPAVLPEPSLLLPRPNPNLISYGNIILRSAKTAEESLAADSQALGLLSGVDQNAISMALEAQEPGVALARLLQVPTDRSKRRSLKSWVVSHTAQPDLKPAPTATAEPQRLEANGNGNSLRRSIVLPEDDEGVETRDQLIRLLQANFSLQDESARQVAEKLLFLARMDDGNFQIYAQRAKLVHDWARDLGGLHFQVGNYRIYCDLDDSGGIVVNSVARSGQDHLHKNKRGRGF